LIAAQDVAAAQPLALCVSYIFKQEDHRGIVYSELEVTDGWYRLRAKIDAPMSRAVKRGIIRIGRKIGVAGVRVGTLLKY